MTTYRVVGMIVLAAMAFAVAAPASTSVASAPTVPAAATKTYLPFITRPGGCPTSSSRSYHQGPVYQQDGDNPVRPAWNHADKNIELRGYNLLTGFSLGFVASGSDDPQGPPQVAELFNPPRVPAFTNGYRINNWNWAPSPDPGTRGSPDTNWPITVLGMRTTAGEGLRVPSSGYDIGGGQEVIVLFADEDSVLLKYARGDSIVGGYGLHVDNICTDANLLNLYNQLDNPNGPRYQFYGAGDTNPDYNLVNLTALEVFGTARSNEIRVAIVDQGTWMDLRYCADWWQVRPGRSCP